MLHRKIITTILLIVVILLIMPGCSTYQQMPTPTLSATDTISITPTYTFQPSATLTYTPTIPYTPTATFSAEDLIRQFKTIEKLVNQESPDCQFPCWWGILPGVTSWDEAKNFLAQNGLPFYEYVDRNLDNSSKIHMFELVGQKLLPDKIIDIDVNFYIFNYEKVHHIIVRGYYLPITGSIEDNVWSTFSPKQQIQKLGMPSRVQIDGACGTREYSTNIVCQYGLNIFYDKLGILLIYSLKNHKGNMGEVCPSIELPGDGEYGFGIILKSPLDPIPLENYTLGTYRGITFEKATGKTVQDFYKLFLDPNRIPCFNVLPDAFPH